LKENGGVEEGGDEEEDIPTHVSTTTFVDGLSSSLVSSYFDMFLVVLPGTSAVPPTTTLRYCSCCLLHPKALPATTTDCLVRKMTTRKLPWTTTMMTTAVATKEAFMRMEPCTRNPGMIALSISRLTRKNSYLM